MFLIFGFDKHAIVSQSRRLDRYIFPQKIFSIYLLSSSRFNSNFEQTNLKKDGKMKCSKCGRDFPSIYYFKTDKVCIECFKTLTPEGQQKEIYSQLMKHPMTTTTFTIEGYRIVKQLGVVRGITVRSRSIFGTIGASLQTIIGGNISLFTELCEKSREEAFDMMVEHSEQIWANAVIGVRYDTTELMSGVTEMLCYGTAVIVEKVS